MRGYRYYSRDEIQSILQVYEPHLDLFVPSIFINKTIWNGVSFMEHVENQINKVKAYLRHHISDNSNNKLSHQIAQVLPFYDRYVEVTRLGLEGKRSLAYQYLDEYIMPGLTFSFGTFKEFTHHKNLHTAETDYVFRMRTSSDNFNSPFKKHDLFHVPFEKRHLVKNNRFSLSGFPCLYFSNSIYCCWEELGRPPLKDCYISRFDLTEHSLIDLTITAPEIKNQLYIQYHRLKDLDSALEIEVKQFEYLLLDYLLLWPLIFCCSIKVFHIDSMFHPEYIIPQLLLEWIISTDFDIYDGIKFPSTREPLLKGKLKDDIDVKMKNYVIPVRDLADSGFCRENIDKITLTEPINIEIEKFTNPVFGHSNPNGSYHMTEFGRLEKILKNMDFDKLSEESVTHSVTQKIKNP